jgi:hypothetical protein
MRPRGACCPTGNGTSSNSVIDSLRTKPLPKDEQNPLANKATHDDLILWLAYKEAKAMITFDEAQPPKGQKDMK